MATKSRPPVINMAKGEVISPTCGRSGYNRTAKEGEEDTNGKQISIELGVDLVIEINFDFGGTAMGVFYEEIPANIIDWVLQQKVFWVSTAPLSKE
ncbi:hypothetical protein F5Y17DRAFT_456867 [Xylariaceae sp. FL0594]|nr:hypothetical protein F5Y17DRAFT_456867 [Xylariaceae sp. FL0594]